MKETEIILNSKPYLLSFNYDCYPDNFQSFCSDFLPFIKSLDNSEYSSYIEKLINDIDNYLSTLSSRDRKRELDKIKQILALFVVPAVISDDTIGISFANELNNQWNNHFQKYKFLVGTYEKIMEGFDANLLGLPLRKHNKFK